MSSGLRNAVSLLLEMRGVGLGRAHFKRRVHTEVLAATAVIEAAAEQGAALVALAREAGERTAAQACAGQLVVEARQTTTRRTMTFLDAKSGEDRTIEVDWRAADPLDVVRRRSRPCGYVIGPGEAEAAARLALLGVRVQRVRVDADWSVERYRIDADRSGRRQDARGEIGDPGGIRALVVSTSADRVHVPAGSYYVTLAQPLAGLAAAALEPDTQNSYAASRILDPGDGHLLRAMAVPDASWLEP